MEWIPWPYQGGTEAHRTAWRRWRLYAEGLGHILSLRRIPCDLRTAWYVDAPGMAEFELDGGDLPDDDAKTTAVREVARRLRLVVDALEAP